MKNYKYINPCREKNINTSCVLYRNSHLKALPTERGKVKPVDCPTVDDRPRVLKSRGRKKQEKRGLTKFEAHAFRRGLITVSL